MMEDNSDLGECNDLSVDSTIPTDLSLSEISDLKHEKFRTRHGLKSTKQQLKANEKITRQLLEKKQLEHDIQVLRIELNQKEYLLENFKTEYQLKIEELEEKLTECKHQKHILQAKSENQLHIQQDEARRRQDKLVSDLELIKGRLKDLERTNETLRQKSSEIKQQMREDTSIDESKYFELRSMTDDLVSVKDMLAMRIYEAVRPFRVELDEVKSHCSRLQANLDETSAQASNWKQELDEERRQHATAQVRLAKLSTQAADLECRVGNNDYRLDNYDRVQRERDELEKQLNTIKDRNTILESELASSERDRKHFEQEHMTSKSALSLLTQDKDYLSRQVSALTNKLAYTEDRLQRQNADLDDIKRAREDLFEKYVHSRDMYKTQYEQQLQAEMRQMSSQTQEEVEKLRSTTRAMYEMENRSLRESRDIALAERDKAVLAESELSKKYHELQDEYRHERGQLDSRLSQLTSEAKMGDYERQRCQLLQEETSKNLKDCQLENEKLLLKLQVANKEYYGLELQYTKKVNDAEAKIREQQTRLTAYENIEKELDEVILQAAEVDTDLESEKVMFSYGYGATIPSSSQRRMKQSVHLARRCIQLERKSVADKRDIDELRLQIKELTVQLEKATEKLNATQQPYSYMISKAQELEGQVKDLQKANHILESDLKTITRKLNVALTEKKKLHSDLEATAQQHEEIQLMKESLRNFLRRAENHKRSKMPSKQRLTLMDKLDMIVKSRALLEHATEASIREAQDLLWRADFPENVAARVLDGSMRLDEAVDFMDQQITLLKKGGYVHLETPSRPQLESFPLQPAVHESQELHQPASIQFDKKVVKRIKKPASGRRS